MSVFFSGTQRVLRELALRLLWMGSLKVVSYSCVGKILQACKPVRYSWFVVNTSVKGIIDVVFADIFGPIFWS